jgi:aryl-alcohol dehydrogenase-like predicted oxidoreductase
MLVVKARRPTKEGRRREVVLMTKAVSMVGKSKRQQHKDRQHRREEVKEKLVVLVPFISVFVRWGGRGEGVRW